MLSIVNRRIPIHGPSLRRFCKWINRHYAIDAEIKVEVISAPDLNDFSQQEIDDHVPVSDEETVFAIYVPKLGTIFLSQFTLYPDSFLTVFAHEYCHALQDAAGRPMTETEADSWAVRALVEYRT